ncbi:MAG: hypothetical protein ABSF50_13720 [Burkholderiaceae bacterium]|jgi:hypothetical protein
MKYPVCFIAIAMTCLPLAAQAFDYPTVDRVEFVHACMRDNPGPAQEMIYKCSCVIDAFAQDMSYEDFVDVSTAGNAFTIGGEIGESVRDSATIRKLATRYREEQAKAKKACFIH